MRGCYGMRTLGQNLSLLGKAALLVAGGVGLGAFASTLATEARMWQAPPRSLEPMIEPAVVDHAAAGRSWARAAFDGGLRRCPDLNPVFVAGCDAELKALAARPAFQPGSYGGPLLITRIEPVAPEPHAPGREDEPARAEHAEADLEVDEVLPPLLEPTPANYPAAAPGT